MSATSLPSMVSIPRDVMFRDVGGESVILNLETGFYYCLDNMATGMWSLLASAPSVVAAYHTLLAEFDVAPAVLRRDMRILIADLQKNGLLTVSHR